MITARRPQAADREGVGGEHHEQIAGDPEHGRDRVQREHQVRGLDGHQRHEQEARTGIVAMRAPP
jgi:hypothetical protein